MLKNKSFSSVILSFVFSGVFFPLFSQQLTTVFDTALCGLEYTSASALITQRLPKTGLSYNGAGQPATLVVSNMPASSAIVKAFAWWDIAGTVVGQNNIIIKNPNNVTDTFQGNLIGGGLVMCQGRGYAFRADVTDIITGNGIYQISGLPLDTTLDFVNKRDVNGVTLMIFYSNPNADFVGAVKINDGYVKVINDTLIETMNNVSLLLESDTAFGKAFMLVSDLQGQPGNTIQLNGSAFTSYAQTFWDFEEKNTAFLPAIKYSTFGVRSPNDCAHLICTGVYFKEDYTENIPTISQQSNDTLVCDLANAYQWYINGNIIQGAISQQHVAQMSGIYHVETFNEYGCSVFSDTLTVKTCTDRIKPNIYFSNNVLYTDSVNYDLQWYYAGAAIANATDPTDTVMVSGYYWVQAYDSETGCVVVSDSVFANYVGIAETMSYNHDLKLYPNPVNNNEITITINGSINSDLQIIVTNLLGDEIYKVSSIFTQQQNKIITVVDLPVHISNGMYWVIVQLPEHRYIKKMIVSGENH